MPKSCRFCSIYKAHFKAESLLCETKLFYSIRDKSPATRGHSLIVSKRHVVSLFDLKASEWADLKLALKKTARSLSNKDGNRPAGYNFGINEGRAAGRTIDHFHMHVIPRYGCDVSNPKGGVRNIFKKQ